MEGGENLWYPITTGSQPLIGPWPVLKRTALTALSKKRDARAVSLQKKKLYYASEKRWLSYFSNTWYQLRHSGRGPHGTCSNLVFYLHDNRWIIFSCILISYRMIHCSSDANACKIIKSAGSYAKKRRWFQNMSRFLQCIKLKQLYTGIKKYLFSNISSSLRCSLVTDFFWQSLRKLSKTLSEIGTSKNEV